MRRWYTPVILVVLVVFVAFAGWWGVRMFTEPLDPTSACETTSLTVLRTDQVQVRVYNAGTVKGQATTIAAQLESAGFVINSTGNAEDDDYTGTTIVGASGDDPQVQLVASFFPGAAISTDNRQNGLVDVVVTDDLGQGFKADAATGIDVPSGSVCLPVAQASATATTTS
ncbi:LytR C-terminal domain-containing protein [uncultured Propionibacterium sp.]|uniref:LytR C-terminal domain-containing protein n=1 Tax=uncultured Propionibacterium sp. TaxID=218066 RepID=UPI00292E3E7E|nr:LytR C-terminal domain-containing protein [uncultured Propionibacterium sp.]